MYATCYTNLCPRFAPFPNYHGVLVELSAERTVPLFNSLVRGELWTAKFCCSKLPTLLYCVMNCLGVDHHCDKRTNGPTDRITITIATGRYKINEQDFLMHVMHFATHIDQRVFFVFVFRFRCILAPLAELFV